MRDPIWSYPKIHNLGHPAIRDLLADSVVVQEKIDGSQFSFGVIGGQLRMRSKGQTVFPETVDKLFAPAVDTVIDLYRQDLLPEGMVFRCETLYRPKHNTLAYDRIPQGHLVLFDVEAGDQSFLLHDIVKNYAEELGLDVAPVFDVETLDLDAFRDLLETESFLGGTKIEGVVIKNYYSFGRDGKALMGKHVSEAFKERHDKDWKTRNPKRADVVQALISTYRTEARWAKAVQHLRERGELEDSPRDIGPLIKELHADFDAECADEVKDALYKHFAPQLKRGVSGGFAEWFKARLAELQFSEDSS